MKEWLHRPLVMALILGFAAISGYVAWVAWEMWRLGRNNIAMTFSPPSSPSLPAPALAETAETVEAETVEIVEATETMPIAASKPVVPAPPTSAQEEAREVAHAEAGVVFIVHSSTEPVFTPLQAARMALTQGNLEAAHQQFASLLQTDPHHLEALLGEASIALRRNEPETAWRFYQMAWVAHPQDARVQAGMLSMLSATGQIDPQSAESRLKNLIAQQPQAAAPHFTLGNLLAGQGRWPEAQAAYFEACLRDTNNPDYRFNLAVSLDMLRHPKLALAHYRAALAAAEAAPASFALADVQARLETLRQAEAP